jgi:hypothetical protein
MQRRRARRTVADVTVIAPDPAVTDPPPSPPRRRKWRIVIGAGAVLALLAVPVVWSYVRALTGPGSDPVSARTIEWGREHHLGWLIDKVERRYYASHQARVGGAPDPKLVAPVLAQPDDNTGPAALAPTTVSRPHGGTIPLATASAPTAASSSAGPASSGPASSAASGASTPGLAAGAGGGTDATDGTDPASAHPTAADPTVADPTAADPTTPEPVFTTPTQAMLPPSPLQLNHRLSSPAPLTTPADSPVNGEGQWHPLGPLVDGVAGAYATLIRPDGVHTSSLDAVVWIDPHVLALRQFPGVKIPGPWDRPDYVPAQLQPRLVAGFEGGFRLADSHGGMYMGGHVLRALRTGAATLSVDQNGFPNVGAWGTDITMSPSLDSARQNLDLIVDNGAPAPDLATDPNRKWGFTGPANNSAVWRSGVGITPNGALVWIGGNGLTVEALADTLVRAGAVRGMQLDINHEWVQFNTYVTGPNGTSGKKLLPDMQHDGNRWLTTDTRDFLAVLLRP